MRRLRNSRFFRVFAVFVTFSLVWQMIHPAVAYGLTSGPSQPEMQGFEPIGTTDMVDLFSGDFKYNIPLLDVGGYPINMVYNSGVTMDQEASWVGLGWSLNPGAINRNLRGIPDDFNGDKVEESVTMLDNVSYGVNLGATAQLAGLEGVSIAGSFGVSYNNYKGLGLELSLQPMVKVGSLNASASFGASSESGLSISPSFSYSALLKEAEYGDGKVGASASLGFSASYNTRAGLAQVSFNGGIQQEFNKTTALAKDEVRTAGDLGGASLGSAITFGPSYFPASQYSMINNSYRFQATIGGEVFPFHPGGQITGYVSTQKLAKNKFSRKAFGYHYLSNKHIKKDDLLDYNTEKDGPFSEHSSHVYLAGHTNDMFSVTGQGLVGSFQGHRSDVGFGYEAGTRNTSSSTNLSIEVGGGNVAHGGGSILHSATNSSNANWSDNNQAAPKLERKNRYDIGNREERAAYQDVAYRFSGELHRKQDLYNGWGGYDPVTLDVKEISPFKARLRDKYVDYKGNQYGLNKNYHADRHGLKKQVSVLTAEEAKSFAFQKSIKSYLVSDIMTGNEAVSNYGRTAGYRKANHFSEFRITDEQGWTYVYGLPAYNVRQDEVSFSTGGLGVCQTGLVNFSSGQNAENSLKNEAGRDHYYSKKSIPPYAHSFLLTAVLPPDYRDLDSDGISEVDLGNAIEFKYRKLPGLYKWRTPMSNSSNMANYNPGYISKKLDDKANYVYGEKELWYVTAIESKTHIAIFHTSDREDAKGASNENGGIDGSNKQLKLDSIQLFSRANFEAAINDPQVEAVPIKTVHFEYGYELCSGTPNSSASGGEKLTLKKLYFTYGKSRKAKLNKYEFRYYGQDEQRNFSTDYNPGYNLRGSDRWGTYKPNTTLCGLNDPMSNIDFPYTPQNQVLGDLDPLYDETHEGKTLADHYASVWNLTEIDLPSGGRIQVNYEADDYAFVQDKRAMRMFKIAGIGPDDNFANSGPQLYTEFSNTYTHHEYVFFEIDEAHWSLSSSELSKRYLAGVDTLYFKIHTEITSGNYEYVTGYARIKDKGFYSNSSGYTKGYLRLETIGIKDKNQGDQISPMLKTALQYTRIHMPELVYPGSDPKGTGESALKGLASLIFDVKAMIEGFNAMLLDRGMCSDITLSKSFMRINEPTFSKEGGGSRVRAIKINDRWEDMLGNQNDGTSATYGQTYDYTTTHRIDGEDKTISSGVASYEPMIGNDENPFRMPVAVTIEHAMAPDDENYIETPFGEMFFPSPSVGYSKVTVRNLEHQGVERTATGWTVHEYFTARDFPTRVSYTPMQLELSKISSFAKFFSQKDRKLLAATQGYSIILNDMHGRQKSTMTYAESGERVSGTKYNYKTDPDHHNRLSNTVKLIKPGTNGLDIVSKEYGVEVDIINHFKSSDLTIDESDFQANLDAFFLGIFPVPLVGLFTPDGYTEHLYRLASTTKVIQQHGLVEEVIAYDFGSSISTKNLAYDYHTGEVLVTQTFNEYRDPIYNITYPGYWAYSGLGPASLNQDVFIDGVSISNGAVSVPAAWFADVHQFFEVGDMVMLYYGSGSLQAEPYWVLEVTDGGAGNDAIKLADRFGESPANRSGVALRVLKSGKVNTPTIPVGTITSATDPLDPGFLQNPANTKVINAQASTYSDYWQMHTYNCNTDYLSCSCDTNKPLIREFELFLNDMAVKAQLFNPNFEIGMGAHPLDEYESLRDILYEVHPTGNPQLWQNSVNEEDWEEVWGYINAEEGITDCGFLFDLKSALLTQQGYTESPWENLREIIIHGPVIPEEPYCDEAYYKLNASAIFVFRTVVYDETGEIPTFDYEVEVDTLPLTITSDNEACYPFVTCFTTGGQIGAISPGTTVNPYLYGILGNWQQKQSFTYQVDRDYSSNNISKDGVFASFTPFWDVTGGKLTTSIPAGWVAPSKVTKRSPHGFEVENEDILGLYSSARFGYSYTLPTDIAQNAEYREAGFESFEDIGFLGDACIPRHLGFTSSGSAHTDDVAHTGTYSLLVPATESAQYGVTIQIPDCPDGLTSPSYPYVVNHCDMLPAFTPGSKTDGTEYVMSFWYYYDQPDATPDYDQPGLTVTVNGVPVTPTVHFVSPVIERWQKIDFLVDLPTVSDNDILSIGIDNSSATDGMYIDDIRVFPFNGTMKSYVYDPVSLRLVAELDENNYATLYEYDKEGILIRVKKETERGIMTIQETRQHKSFVE